MAVDTSGEAFAIGFFSKIPILGALAGGMQSDKDKQAADLAKQTSDRMAGLEAVNIQKAAQKEKNAAIANMNQAAMDAEMNVSLAEEAGIMAGQITKKGDQAAEQIKTAGALTSGSQQAMLAATGQSGAGSATGLMAQTKANTASDVRTTLSNAATDASVYTTRQGGYNSLAKTLGDQATLYKTQADEIDPDAESAAYLTAYFGE